MEILIGLIVSIILFNLLKIKKFLTKIFKNKKSSVSRSNNDVYFKRLKTHLEKELISNKKSVEDAFDGFVGNEGSVLQIKRMLRYAQKTEIKVLPNLAFFGPKSTGKTELARRIANFLEIPTLTLSKSTLNSEESFFKEVSKEIEEFSNGVAVAPEMIIFIDEVHVLPRRIQDSLLTALERDDRCFRSKLGDINTHNVTFIVATTDPGKLSEAFKSRLTIFWLEPYSVRQIIEILKLRIQTDETINKAAQLIPDAALELIARCGRGTPRGAINLLRQVSVALALGDVVPTTPAIAADLQRTLACDAHGLVEIDRKYLKTLREYDIAGLGLLSAALGTDKDNIEKGIEPFLIQSGWVYRTNRGRKLSDKGLMFVENYL